VLDPQLVEQLAGALGTDAGLIEKDWHVTRALGVLAGIQHDQIRPTFSGGTSLSKGWGLIKRFSEDIDFKVAGDADRNARRAYRAYREQVITTLQAAGFVLQGEPAVRDSSRFFSADFAYASEFPTGPGLRPHLRVEMSFHTPALPPVTRSLQSLIGQAMKQVPEVAAFPCIDPVETAADKLSALAWRVCTRQRGSEGDDATVVRHLHDLAALEKMVATAPAFKTLTLQAAADDAGRGGGTAPANLADRFAAMLNILETDKLWTQEYDSYVHQVSFARQDEIIAFGPALDAVARLVGATSDRATNK
jgi:hypothetical protein